MSEQSARREPADRPRSDRPRSDRPQSAEQSRPGQPRPDLVGDLQRWLIRSSARSMRNQFEDQVRRTLGGQRPDKGDVWDIATTEIPPEVGEAPECQWCPICRAARRMRDAGPDLGGQLSGAGDAVASAVHDALRGVDSFLARAARSSQHQDSGPSRGQDASARPDPDLQRSGSWQTATAPEEADPGKPGTGSDGPNGRGHGPGDRG